MKTTKQLLLVSLCLASATLFAQSAFEGTWRFSAQSGEFGGKPETFSLQKGVYRCDSCVPKIEVKADGEYHKVSGSPYYDTVSARAADDHTIEVMNKKGSKVVGTAKMTASPDGNTLTEVWTFVSEGGQSGNGTTISKRVAPVPQGANKASGSWQAEKLENASDSVLLVTYKLVDGGLSMSDQTGDSYTAKFDGKDYPYKGDPGTTSVSLKKIDANSIEETDKRDGKVIFVSRMTVSPDGRTLKVAGEDKLHSTTFKFDATKQ
jgi:hypothetical protein